MISTDRFLRRKPYIHQTGGVRLFCRLWESVLLLLIMMVGCKQAVEIEQEALFGRWDVMKAERNGRETPYLRGGYFIIEKNGSMTVNITGADEKGPYTLHQNRLSSSHDKEFIITSLQPDSMTLRFLMEPGTEFLFFLQKRSHDAQ